MPWKYLKIFLIHVQWYFVGVVLDVLASKFTSLIIVVAKMTSHAIFQYNVLVIDIDNTTLGLI